MRLNRETNPVPGEKPGFTPQYIGDDGNAVDVTPSTPYPTTDSDVKAELELVKAELQAIKDGTLKTQLTGSNASIGTTSPAQFGSPIPIDLELEEDRPHRAFGMIESAPDDTLYLAYRAGYTHGISGNGLGGDIKITRSVDYGKTWETPKTIATADVGRNLSDVCISYDSVQNKWFITYVDVNQEYTDSDVIILRGDDPWNLDGFTDVTMSPRALSSRVTAFHKIKRHGSRLYLPIYGKEESTDSHRVGLIRSTDGTGTNWETRWIAPINGNVESALFFVYDEEKDNVNFHLIERSSPTAKLRISEDDGETWTDPIPLPFKADGGPQVFDLDGTYMLLGRTPTAQGNGMSLFAAFSRDGKTFPIRQRFGNSGPGYFSMASFSNGKSVIAYFEEYAEHSRIYLRDIIDINPRFDLLPDYDNKEEIILIDNVQIRDTSNYFSDIISLENLKRYKKLLVYASDTHNAQIAISPWSGSTSSASGRYPIYDGTDWQTAEVMTSSSANFEHYNLHQISPLDSLFGEKSTWFNGGLRFRYRAITAPTSGAITLKVIGILH